MGFMRTHRIKHGNNWPHGISDGLVLPCAICGKENIQFDYGVTDELWNEIVPKEIKPDVICLSCLDKLAKEKGADLGSNIVGLQFTGIGMTVKFTPTDVFYYIEEARDG